MMGRLRNTKYRGKVRFGSTLICVHFRYRFAGLGHAKMLQFPSEAVRNSALNHPEVFKLLYMATSLSARRTISILYAASAMRLPQKVAYFLLEVAKRFPHVDGAIAMISISQAVLAQILGLSRPKLNQELNVLEHNGMISIDRKRICITNQMELGKHLLLQNRLFHLFSSVRKMSCPAFSEINCMGRAI